MNKVSKVFWYVGLALLAVAGFNYFYGPVSIPSAYAEAFAITGGLLIWLGSIFLRGAITRLPSAAVLALAFAALGAMQSFAFDYSSSSRVLSFQMYMLWAAVLSVACLRYRDALGDEHFTDSIAWAVFVGAFLAALIGWAGLWGWEVKDGIHIYRFYYEGTMNGPLAQRNLYASSLVLGLIGLAWVSISWKRQALILPSLGFILALPLMVTASRVGLLEIVVLFGVALWGRIVSGKSIIQKFCTGLLLLLAVALVLQLLASPIMAVINPEGESALQRLVHSSYASRLQIWLRAWHIFIGHPLGGVGAGNYPWFDYLGRVAIPDANHDDSFVAVTHAHNLVLQILAEMGLIGGFLLGLCGWFWLKSWRGCFLSAQKLFVVLLSIPLLLHSMLEYPLWYANFLGVIVLSATSWDSWLLRMKFPRLLSGLFVGAGVLSVFWGVFVLSGLIRINHAIELDWQGQHEAAVRQAVDVSQRNIFLEPYASLLLVNRAVPGSDTQANQLYELMAERVVRWIPFPESVYNLALWQASTGKFDLSRVTLSQAVVVYPDLVNKYNPRWQKTNNEPDYKGKQNAFSQVLRETKAKLLLP